MSKVSINLYNLWVEIEDEHKYPDQVSDLSHRCLEMYKDALKYAKDNGIDITNADFDLLDDGFDEEDD